MLHSQMPSNRIEMDQRGLNPLLAATFETRLCGKYFVGLYRAPFQFVLRIGVDKTLWGQNNYGTEDRGQWSIDPTTHTFSVRWLGAWDDTTTVGYADGSATHLFDVQTGVWRTSLLREIDESELIGR